MCLGNPASGMLSEGRTHQEDEREGDEDGHVELARLVLLEPRRGQLAERLDLHEIMNDVIL